MTAANEGTPSLSTVLIDGRELTIVEEVPIVDGLLKKIIKHGEGESPNSGNQCTMHYTGVTASDGNKFDSSRDRNDPFTFKVGIGQVIQGWDKGVVTMKKGEECILCIRSDLGYGPSGAGAAIPPDADLDFHVELLDFSEPPKEMHEMTEDERMEYAEEQKRLGNEAIAKADYPVAARHYEAGLHAFQVGAADEDLNEAHKALKLGLHSNFAIAMLKTKNYQQAIIHCRAVITMDEKNVKARYNLCQSFAGLTEFDQATRMCQTQLEREDLSEEQKKMFTRQLATLHQASAVQDRKEKAVYSRMFK